MDSFAQAPGASTTLTFDSIDGPPPQVFERFVEALNAEAQAKALPIVSREGTATYRVRAYLAAQISRGRTTIAWTFDIYEAGQQRALRLTGEEPAGKPGRDAWTVADAQLLRRIAQNGMAGVAAADEWNPAEPEAAATGRPLARTGRGGRHAQAPQPAARTTLAFRASKFFVHHQNGLILRRKTRLRHIASGSPLLDITLAKLRRNPRNRTCRRASQDGVMLNNASTGLQDKTVTSAKNGDMKLVAGNSNPALANAIAAHLQIPLSKAIVRRFADMEIFVEIQENVRGSDVFVVQSTSYPANDHLMELLIIIDALRRASARRITAVIPYFGYARQDRKVGSRSPISAKLVANLITHAGADRVLTLDLHAGQIQGFFDIPTDNLYAAPMMVRHIKDTLDLANVMVVSPDVGGVARARGLAKRINAPLAIVDKRRERAGESEVMNIIGDVTGHTCILIDDIVDSGGTLVNAADALLANGAKDVYAYITHGVLSGGAVARITASKLKELVITELDPADRGRPRCPQRAGAVGRHPDRRSDRAHRVRRVGLQPVRLNGGLLLSASP